MKDPSGPLSDQHLRGELIQAQKMEAIGMLVPGIAHELNNPLASIIAFSQLLQLDTRLPPDLRADADLLIQEAERTRRIVRNLLEFARQRPPERHPTSLRALVDSILDLQSYGINAGRIEVHVDVPDDIPLVPLDRSQMQQVLLNLTMSAIQAMQTAPGPSSLRIVATRRADRVQLAVIDSGPGVPDDPGTSTNLGLSVSFGIVAAHGGELRHAPGPGGRGATFTIELPLGAGAGEPAEAETPLRTRPVAAVETPEAGESPAPLVLILDDEPSIRTFLSKALHVGGFDSTTTAEGPDAVAAAADPAVVAVLCDHRLPGMTGTDVYEAIVAMRPELATRFVMMSGDILDPELREFAADRGIALLAKPFDIDTVNRIVRSVIDGS